MHDHRPARKPFIRYKEEILGERYTRHAPTKSQKVLADIHRKELQEETEKIIQAVVPKIEETKSEKKEEETDAGLILSDIIRMEQQKLQTKEVMELNKRDRAVRFGFIGIGQGGSRIAESFSGFNYPTIVLNTSQQDLDGLHILDKHKLAIGEDGAGKDMAIGAKAVRDNRDKILSMLATNFDGVDHIMITAGGGGGTGSGGLTEILDVLSFGEYNNVGVILTLPLKGEDTKAKANTIETLTSLVKLNNDGKISPFIVIDNAKIMEKYPEVSTSEFWAKANTEISRLFHLFNKLTFHKSSFTSLDPADYRNIIQTNGFTILGKTTLSVDKLDNDSIKEAIEQQVSQSGGLLASGFNIVRALKVGGILVGKQERLNALPRKVEEYIFDTLRRHIRAGTVYRGVYAIDSIPDDKLELLTIWSGLDTPSTRIIELYEESKKEGKIVEKKIDATAVEDILKGLDDGSD